MEFILSLSAPQNSSEADQAFCDERIVLGWARKNSHPCRKNTTDTTDTSFSNKNAIFIGCQTRLLTGSADVVVDSEGRIQSIVQLEQPGALSAEAQKNIFGDRVANLLAQSNRYLFPHWPIRWHNDSTSYDFMNYFMSKHMNNSRLIDPGMPPPNMDEITARLYPVYEKMFAIWLGINKNKLFVPSNNATAVPIHGHRIIEESRIFMSKPLMIIAEVILVLYAIVAFGVYAWRPGRFLPRMPTSIAAVIALFAAGSAVQDLEGTSEFSKKQRRAHLKALGHRYGYGKFLGFDGSIQVGIEKEPFLQADPDPGVIKRIQTSTEE